MNKTLIALAALAATGAAFAQSTVSLTGTLEVAPLRAGTVTTQTAPGAPAIAVKSSNTAQHNTWSTSVLNFSATEDLGKGLTARAVMISGVGDGFAARERSLALSGGFGTVRVGRFVPAAAAGFHALSGTGSATLVGSMYGLSTGSTAASPNGLHTNATNFERQDNVLQYTSPSFGGLTANLAFVQNKSDSNAVAAPFENANQQTSLHLGYAKGPVALGLGLNNAKGNVEGAAAVAAIVGGAVQTLGSAAVPFSSTESNLNWVGASYDLKVARLFATYVTREGEATNSAGVTTTGTDIKATGLGVSVPVGAFTLRASVYAGKDARGAGAADNVKLSGSQLSAVYALSKRTSVIVATGVNEFKRDGAASTAATRKTSASTLALNHTF